MSARHPIIAITGSSGAGTSTVMSVFHAVCSDAGLRAAYVEGDAFHALDREQMQAAIARARIRGENFSHFGPAANLLDKLEGLFRDYSEDGRGWVRRYLHTETEAIAHGLPVGSFTEWERLPAGSDVLIYEGLHGGLANDEYNIAQYVDLLIGVSPIINLEWIQKIRRDTEERGHAPEDVTRTILRRMPDYVNYITPQFSRTDVNFQRVPLVDTSNPFVVREIPRPEESLVVIHFAEHARLTPNFSDCMARIPAAFMPRPDTMVVPGEHQQQAMALILGPAVERLAARRHGLERGGVA